MKFEVEVKHRVADSAALAKRLRELGAVFGSPVVQADQYFNHPARDFARTDEALRIRTVGAASFVTYKGPKLDAATKTRRELEFPLSTDGPPGAGFAELLHALGFQPVAVVRKERRTSHVEFAGHAVEIALDTVEGLGDFVELELQAAEGDLDEARHCVRALADKLSLGPPERRSYLEMLLAPKT